MVTFHSEEVRVTLGQAISHARKEAGLTLHQLASRVVKENGTPISQVYLHDIETGKSNPRSEYLLRQLAQALDLPPEYLYFLAGTLPTDLRAGSYTPERVQAAFQAFRSALAEE